MVDKVLSCKWICSVYISLVCMSSRDTERYTVFQVSFLWPVDCHVTPSTERPVTECV